MLRIARRCATLRSDRRFAIVLRGLLTLACASASAQDVSVVRLPQSTDMTVRLRNLTTHVNYDASGNSYLIVPTGRYSVQLLRRGQIAYEEVEFIGPNSPQTRTVNPQAMNIVVGLPDGNPQFDANLCSALATATHLSIASYGLRDGSVEERLRRAELNSGSNICTTLQGVTFFTTVLAGSYGVTPLGMLDLSIESTALAPQRRPPNHGNSPIYKDPSTQRLATNQQPGSNLTPELVGDLKNGITDVAVDDNGKSLLVCAAIDANTPLFCDSNGFAVATPAIAHLRGLYRFHMKTTPVDHQGVEDDHWTTYVTEAEYRETQEKLANALQTVQQNLTQRIAQADANSVTVASAHTPGQTSRHYATADLQSLISATQKEIESALHDNTLQPLLQHFPAALSQVNPDQPSIGENEAQRVFRDLTNAVNSLTGLSNQLDIDLIFRTTPVETEGTRLNFDNCERCNPIVSQGGEHRFYRGKYHVRATLDGYVPFDGWLDLAEDPKTIFECHMVRALRGVSDQSSTCSLRAQ
jgi:hypothetical protein